MGLDERKQEVFISVREHQRAERVAAPLNVAYRVNGESFYSEAIVSPDHFQQRLHMN